MRYAAVPASIEDPHTIGSEPATSKARVLAGLMNVSLAGRQLVAASSSRRAVASNTSTGTASRPRRSPATMGEDRDRTTGAGHRGQHGTGDARPAHAGHHHGPWPAAGGEPLEPGLSGQRRRLPDLGGRGGDRQQHAGRVRPVDVGEVIGPRSGDRGGHDGGGAVAGSSGRRASSISRTGMSSRTG